MRRVAVVMFVLLLIAVSLSLVPPDPSVALNQESPQPIVISGAVLIDGSGRPPLDDSVVVVNGDSITAVGRRGHVRIPAQARVIDARGLVLAPGFIDAHNHSDRGLREDPSAATQVSQGITTIAIGQDGGSPFPIGEYLSQLDRDRVALNILTFVGHATLRTKVMGDDTNRRATNQEIAAMKRLTEQAMKDGAFGLSSGLEYETGKPATTEEVIALASVASKFQGIYISHIRDEADKAFDAFRELIRISREARLPAQISHIKLGSAGVWGRARAVVTLVEKARRSGLDITADCYPYDAWSSTIRVLVPSGRHDDRADVARALADVGGPANITIVSCRTHPDYEFKNMEEISRRESITPVELYMKIVRDGGAGIVCHSMKESDIKTFYRQPWVMVSSDGGIGARHPRGAGTYPRVLGQYVRDLHWLTLPEAIKKMTSLPARRFSLRDRGLIRAGFKADLVLFDANTIIDRATFEQPQLTAVGVQRVFVNGVEVWNDGRVTGKRPGRALRRY